MNEYTFSCVYEMPCVLSLSKRFYRNLLFYSHCINIEVRYAHLFFLYIYCSIIVEKFGFCSNTRNSFGIKQQRIYTVFQSHFFCKLYFLCSKIVKETKKSRKEWLLSKKKKSKRPFRRIWSLQNIKWLVKL